MPDTLLRLACLVVPAYFLLLGPRDALLRVLWRRQRPRTWHWETLVVAGALAVVVTLAGNDPLEWVGLAALVLAHGRNSIMFRLTEAQSSAAPADPHHVECHAWAGRYFLAAEVFWATYFALHGAWAALCGVAVFVGYARWRRWRTARPPRGRGPRVYRRRAPTEGWAEYERRIEDQAMSLE